jgi:GAF domain-containing protein
LHLDKPTEPAAILSAVEQALAAPPPSGGPLSEEFDRKHLQVVTDKLARTVDKMEVSRLRLAALGDLSRQLPPERDSHSVLDHYCQGARRLIAARYAIVLVLDDDRRTILHLCISGLDRETLARLDPSAADLRALCRRLDDGHPFRLRDDRDAPGVLGPFAFGPGPRSLLFVPSSRQAALILVEKLGAEEFSDEDERLVMTLAAQMTLGYENANLRAMIHRLGLADGGQ